MTLANFNNNFNWQLRMLKEAADCCGITPDIPQPPLPPLCFWYLQPGDIYGTSWFPFVQQYELDGVLGDANWPAYFASTNWPIDPAIATGRYYRDVSYPGFTEAVDPYWVYVMSRVQPQSVTGIDNFGFPIDCNVYPTWCNWTAVCEPTCYRSVIIDNGDYRNIFFTGWQTSEIGPYVLPGYTIMDPNLPLLMTAELQRFYGPAAAITIDNPNPDEYVVTVVNVYTNGGFFNLTGYGSPFGGGAWAEPIFPGTC